MRFATICLLIASALPVALPAVLLAGSRTPDGDPADWTGTPPTLLHDSGVSADEWIYKGESGDRRTDPSGTLSNYDLTEVRLTRDTTYLHVLVRYAGITSLDDVHFCMGFDIDQSSSDSNGLSFNGDDSGVLYGTASTQPEYLVSVHNSPDSATEVEFFHDAGGGTWYNLDETANTAFISGANNVVEVRIRLVDLGLTATSPFGFSLVTFDNGTTADPGARGFNNVTDTTVDYPTHDGLDALGGTLGTSENAFSRAFASGQTIQSTSIRSVNLASLTNVEGWWQLSE
jgi:hypothetical protein